MFCYYLFDLRHYLSFIERSCSSICIELGAVSTVFTCITYYNQHRRSLLFPRWEFSHRPQLSYYRQAKLPSPASSPSNHGISRASWFSKLCSQALIRTSALALPTLLFAMSANLLLLPTSTSVSSRPGTIIIISVSSTGPSTCKGNDFLCVSRNSRKQPR